MAERLYCLADMAAIMGVQPTALLNRMSRQGPRSELPPAPAYVYGKRCAPLWTREQVERAIADRQAAQLARLEERHTTREETEL